MRADVAIQRRIARQRGRRKERAVALVMVLMAIVVLTVYLTEVQEEGATAFTSAMAERDRLRAEYLARSAVNLSRMLIAVEPTVRAMIQPVFMLLNPKGRPPQIPVWEFVDQVLGPYNDAAGAEAFSQLAGVDTSSGVNMGLNGIGHFEVAIVDEDSKIDVNIAARGDTMSAALIESELLGLFSPPQYSPLFDQKDPDGQFSDRRAVCGAIIDWANWQPYADPCTPEIAQAQQGGSKDNFYQTIGLPYLRKNAGYDSLDELRLVRGVGDDFWATFVEPDPKKPKSRIMTVWGQGKVNVNTANAQTLLALICNPEAALPTTEICVDPMKAAMFVSTITLVKSFTAGAPLFGSPQDFVNTMAGAPPIGSMLFGMTGMHPVQFKSVSVMRRSISTESKTFSIYATGVVPRRIGAQKPSADGAQAEAEAPADDVQEGPETRVTIHAVVDFRHAATLMDMAQAMTAGAAAGSSANAGANGTNGANGLPSTVNVTGLNGAPLDPTMAQIALSPAGNIIYWRVE